MSASGAETGTVIDYDGNIYATIKIGSQWWMAENLRTTHYAGGTEIPVVDNSSTWTELAVEDKAMCYYDNSIEMKNTYGGLYTWSAAMHGAGSSTANPSMVQGVCPSGWHVPSDAEWKQLEIYLGMSQTEVDGLGHRGTNEGSKLAGHSELWNDGELKEDPGFGTSGFEGIPGGGRSILGAFLYLNSHSAMWSATAYDDFSALSLCLYNSYSEVRRYFTQKQYGFSVRCVKNE